MAAHRRRRNLVVRADGAVVNVARPRGQLLVCATGCCCGRTDDGFAHVPAALYHAEWERRRLRNRVHLTIGGCLGPCALANVVLLLLDGQALWFHSMNSEALVLSLYDHVELMLDAGRCLPAPPSLAALQFTASAWQPRPDGQPVDDVRPRRPAPGPAHGARLPPPCVDESSDAAAVARLLGALDGSVAVPRRNGELVFEEPWQGRAFGMAVALHEAGLFAWEEFRQALIPRLAEPQAPGEELPYYEAWLGALEHVLGTRELVAPDDLEERTCQFEYGERDDVF